MTYVDNKEKGTSTLKCNQAGCKNAVVGTNHGDAYRKAKAKGWSAPNAETAWCPDHKPSAQRASKAKANGKGAKVAKGKAAAKGGAKKGTIKGSGRASVWSMDRKPEPEAGG